MAVRWYVAYALSYRNTEELLAERGTSVDYSTLNRWVVEYAPLLEDSFRQRHKKSVDKEGNTINFMLSKNRDQKAAEKFLEKAIGYSGLPAKVTIDKSGANKAGLEAINLQIGIWLMLSDQFFEIRQIKYLNNVVEQIIERSNMW